MALEAVVFSQEYNLCNDVGNFSISNNLDINYDFGNYSSMLLFEDNETLLPTNNDGIYNIIAPIDNDNVNQWDHHTQQEYNVSPEQYLCSGEAQPTNVATPAASTADDGVRRKRRRRCRKNKEEVEQQRMTHITVERNRRKQMNEYLAVIRSLMPPSYVQRGDQASIVGGAISYVKELEQMLQSMEAQKKSKIHHSNQNPKTEEEKLSSTSPKGEVDHNGVASSSELPSRPVFADFFSFPQYPTRSDSVTSNSAVGEIEVTLVESHANVKILTKKLPKQLIKLISAFQGLRLNVLHLNVTATIDSFVLYSLSLKVEEACQLNSVDDIAAAANHILAHIQEEAIGLV